MKAKLWNWRLWAGFVLSLVALVGCVLLFPITRAAFWLSLLLFVIVAALLFSGLTRAFREPETYRGKIAGPILAILSVVVLGFFGAASNLLFKNFPEAKNAPKVGQRAPEFALADSTGKNVSLAQLLSSSGSGSPAKGVLVVFYRGYW